MPIKLLARRSVLPVGTVQRHVGVHTTSDAPDSVSDGQKEQQAIDIMDMYLPEDYKHKYARDHSDERFPANVHVPEGEHHDHGGFRSGWHIVGSESWYTLLLHGLQSFAG